MSLQNEPAVAIGSVVAAANAVLVVLVAFGVINDQQLKALAALCTAVLPIAGSIMVRARVVPTAKLPMPAAKPQPDA